LCPLKDSLQGHTLCESRGTSECCVHVAAGEGVQLLLHTIHALVQKHLQ